MKQSYLFHARIATGLSPARMWTSCLKLINRFCLTSGNSYHLTCGPPDFSANLSQDEIIKHLSDRDDGSYLISWRDENLETMQSFSYFAKYGKLSFRFAKIIALSPLDDFGSGLADLLPISNIIVQESTYLDLLRELHVPNRTNLHLAPCYSNGRDGYVEGVSAEMWLGVPFWKHSKCTKAEILNQDWLHCEERPSHLYVRAWPEPFSSAEGEQGEIQRRLLELLFGINGRNPPPLPPPPQSTFVQKVLFDGDRVRDLGMEEVCSDGTRVRISPADPPPMPDNDETRLERAILNIKENPSLGNEELIRTMLSTKGFLIVPDPCKPDQFATVPHPDSGEELLVCYTSEKFVKAACEKVGVTSSHVTYGPFLDVFMECRGDLGIILNPATDAMVAISASLAKATRDIALDIRKK